jgi:hypothetical protein
MRGNCIRDMVSAGDSWGKIHADKATDGPADTLESDSKLKPGQNPMVARESPVNK